MQVTALGQPDMLEAVSDNLTASGPASVTGLTQRHLRLLAAMLGRLTQLADAATEVLLAAISCHPHTLEQPQIFPADSYMVGSKVEQGSSPRRLVHCITFSKTICD